MRVLKTDLAKQLEASSLGARLWRLRPGRASALHRHFSTEELYVVLEGRGRIRGDALWVAFGAPPEGANTLEMSEETLRSLHPEGPRALPPELGGGELRP